MKFKRIANIKKFLFSNANDCITINNGNEIYRNQFYIGTIKSAWNIYQCSNDILIEENYYGKAYIINKGAEINSFLNAEYSVSNVIDEHLCLLYKYDERDKRVYAIYDYYNHKLSIDLERDIDYVYKDLVYGYNETEIYAYRISTGDIQWQYSIQGFPPYINGFFREQPADIKQIIGVYNDVLWIHVGGSRLLGLDIHTGKQIHLLEDIILGEKGNTFLDVEHGTLKTLGADYYGEFDLTTLQYIKKVRFGENEIIRVRYSTYYPNDKNLYFCGFYNKSGIPNIFGIFDTEKAEVVWYDMKKEDGGAFYNPPQANEQYLAILDDKHNLLIYDREKDE